MSDSVSYCLTHSTENEDQCGPSVITGNIQDSDEEMDKRSVSIFSQIWAIPRKDKRVLALLAVSNFIVFLATSILGSIFPEVVGVFNYWWFTLFEYTKSTTVVKLLW